MEANYILEELSKLFPDPKCELEFRSPYELMVAVCLSAQCTDKRVNMVTKEFFKHYPDMLSLSHAKIEDVERLIKSCGLYHNKAKNLINASKQIMNEFNGQIPNDFEKLQSVAGIGRKTANVIRSVAFGEDAIAVDTHVFRVSNRLGISKSSNVLDCELELQKKFEPKDWTKLHYMLVLFGRYICSARSPKCVECPFCNNCLERKTEGTNVS